MILILLIRQSITQRKILPKDGDVGKCSGEACKKYDLGEEATIIRNIQGKCMPSKVSYIPNLGSAKLMSKVLFILAVKV